MKTDHERPWWIVVAIPILIPVAAIALAIWLAWATLLLTIVWVAWRARGRYALVVYSDSPIWHDYFSTRVLPELGPRAVVLNWSARRKWDTSLAVLLFKTFGGGREFNPLALVFAPARWPRRFKFYKAFQSFKKGRVDEVETVRREFFDALNALAPADVH